MGTIDVMNDCVMDWEKGEFIFAAHLQENSLGELNSLPDDIDIQDLLKKTTCYNRFRSWKRSDL